MAYKLYITNTVGDTYGGDPAIYIGASLMDVDVAEQTEPADILGRWFVRSSLNTEYRRVDLWGSIIPFTYSESVPTWIQVKLITSAAGTEYESDVVTIVPPAERRYGPDMSFLDTGNAYILDENLPTTIKLLYERETIVEYTPDPVLHTEYYLSDGTAGKLSADVSEIDISHLSPGRYICVLVSRGINNYYTLAMKLFYVVRISQPSEYVYADVASIRPDPAQSDYHSSITIIDRTRLKRNRQVSSSLWSQYSDLCFILHYTSGYTERTNIGAYSIYPNAGRISGLDPYALLDLQEARYSDGSEVAGSLDRMAIGITPSLCIELPLLLHTTTSVNLPDSYTLSKEALQRSQLLLTYSETSDVVHATQYQVSINGGPFMETNKLIKSDGSLSADLQLPRAKYKEICIRIKNPTYGLSRTFAVVDFQIF